MARLYANENFPLPVVAALRQRGHDVVTSLDVGRAGAPIPDEDVLAFATSDQRAVLTLNRRDFIALHEVTGSHQGMIVCTVNPHADRQARRIDEAISSLVDLAGRLVRVNRPHPAENR